MNHYSDIKAFLYGMTAGFGKMLLDITANADFTTILFRGCVSALLFGACGVIGKYIAVWVKTKLLPRVCEKLKKKK